MIHIGSVAVLYASTGQAKTKDDKIIGHLDKAYDQLSTLKRKLPFNKVVDRVQRSEIRTTYQGVMSGIDRVTMFLSSNRDRAKTLLKESKENLKDVGLLLPFYASGGK